jgi:predicted DsbA family dithiol-disulfide isomerase
MPFELRPYRAPTLRPEGDYLQRAWQQSVYPLARKLGVPIKLPTVSPQPHTHLALEGYQYAKEQGKDYRGADVRHRQAGLDRLARPPDAGGGDRPNGGLPAR